MGKKFGDTYIGNISDVHTVAGNLNTYICKIEMSEGENMPEVVVYVARNSDVAETGQWIYQQITEGNFSGEIIDRPEGVDIFTGEPVVIPDQAEIFARRQRGQLLASTDWTQLPDVPQAIKDLWAPYRQALRDVPQQSGFPANIVWPNPPA